MAKARGRPVKVKIERAIGDELVMNSLAVAELLGCGDRAAMKLMKDGEIASRQVGSAWFTTRTALLDYLSTIRKPSSERKVEA